MSAAAVPQNEGERFAYEAKQDGFMVFSGEMEGATVDFYFHCDNGTFLCETMYNGKPAKMAGELKLKDDGKWWCIPCWGVQPEGDSEWVDTKGEEEKGFDLSLTEIDFEGAKLQRRN